MLDGDEGAVTRKDQDEVLNREALLGDGRSGIPMAEHRNAVWEPDVAEYLCIDCREPYPCSLAPYDVLETEEEREA